MLRVLALLAAILAPAPLLLAHPDEHAPAPPEPEPGLFTSLRLPASTAWVAASYTAVGDASVWGWTTQPGHAGGARHNAGALLMSIEGRDEGLMYGGGWGMGAHTFEVNAKGERVVCCEIPLGAADPDEAEFNVWLLDGETLWLAFVGANADTEQPFEISLAVEGGELSPGPTREGLDVQLVDLVDEAYANGWNVRIDGRTIAGTSAPIELNFSPAKNGFISLSYFPDGHADFRTGLAADDITLAESHAAHGSGLAYALGSQRYDAWLSMGKPPAPSLPGQTSSWPMASLLYADIDVPGSGMAHFEWE